MKSPNISVIQGIINREQMANSLRSIRTRRIGIGTWFQDPRLRYAREIVAKGSHRTAELIRNLTLSLKSDWSTKDLLKSPTPLFLILYNTSGDLKGSAVSPAWMRRSIVSLSEIINMGTDIINRTISQVSGSLDELRSLNISQWKDVALSKLTESIAIVDELYVEDSGRTDSLPVDSDSVADASTDSDMEGKLDTTTITSKLVQFAHEYHSLPDSYWQLVYDKGGITIWRCNHPPRPFGGSSSWPSFKSRVVLDASPPTVADFFYNSTTSQRGNRYSLGRIDIHKINNRTKVVWNRIKDATGLRKPVDFCSMLHWHNVSHSDFMLISIGVDHPMAPPSQLYTRCKIVFGMNLMKSCADPNRTELFTYSNIQYTGLMPYFISKSAVWAISSYLNELKRCLCKGVSLSEP